MKELPISPGDRELYNHRFFNLILNYQQLPLPNLHRIQKYLKENFIAKESVSFENVAMPPDNPHRWKHYSYYSVCMTSDSIYEDIIIHVDTKDTEESHIYFHIAKEFIDDMDPVCTFSLVTNSGSIYKEEILFSKIATTLGTGGQNQTLDNIIATIT